MIFEVQKLTAYKCYDCIIVIYSTLNRCKPFYYKNNSNGNEIIFNLPKGIYYTKNRIDELPKPLTYVLPRLPLAERRAKQPNSLTVYIGENPNKCSIKRSTGEIFIDDGLRVLPIPFLHFILFHELGHYFYKTEWKADLYAVKKMIDCGYNPTQCLYAHYLCLSERQGFRKRKVFNYLNKIKTI